MVMTTRPLARASTRVALNCCASSNPSLVKERLEHCWRRLTTTVEDVSFLERWGYDAEPKAAIPAAIEAV